jgi:elongation factor 1 alpha-like protein
VDEESVPWAVAGSNVTIYLSSIDPIHLSCGLLYVVSMRNPPTDAAFDVRLP